MIHLMNVYQNDIFRTSSSGKQKQLINRFHSKIGLQYN
ncbi:hypothetical protein Ocin01_17420 [Orchesella cincta]|uniref:Uncharacterized protein n=1 Tax=Orchesella cincta TaxID=48709 RepID=A0A1D2M8K2_ORCCI|nr:hypothetical protein Ocin01_17420 [Orchesella cincta]